jgi:hypothetical protein
MLIKNNSFIENKALVHSGGIFFDYKNGEFTQTA